MRNFCKFRWLILFIVLAALMAFARQYGKSVKQSYVDNVDYEAYCKRYHLQAVSDNAYPYDADYDMYGEGEKVHNFQDLEQNADVIVKVKLSEGEKRTIYTECILSQADVMKSWKGDVKTGEKIHIFEPVNCTGFTSFAVLCQEGYTPMVKGEEYILFLRQIKNSHFSKDDYVYLPVSMTYGKYRADSGFPKRYKESQVGLDYMNNGASLSLEDAEKEEVLLFEKEKYQLYLNLKKTVMKNYS